MIDIEKYFRAFKIIPKAPSLNAMQFFMEEYGDFEKQMKFIHVAGTNGKGSCVQIISNILKCAGYRVGKFISPHLISYNERISINGKQISDQDFSNLLEELQPKIDFYNAANKNKITLFEVETTAALLYFYRNNVDIAVLETGLGGLYDCTNIISRPLVSMITSIDFDHTNILGDTLEQIAMQKAGIIKKNSCTVFFAQQPQINNLIMDVCERQENKLHMLDEENITNYKFDGAEQFFDYGTLRKISVPLKGKCQIKNVAMCIETSNILNDLGFNISEAQLRKGIESVVHNGRMEIINQTPLVVYDGAHNPSAIKNLLATIHMYYPKQNKVFLIAILKRKNYDAMIKLLMSDEKNCRDTFIFTCGNDSAEYVCADELFSVAKKYSQKGQTLYKKNLDAAMAFVLRQKNPCFVTGSFYIYADVKRNCK